MFEPCNLELVWAQGVGVGKKGEERRGKEKWGGSGDGSGGGVVFRVEIGSRVDQADLLSFM